MQSFRFRLLLIIIFAKNNAMNLQQNDLVALVSPAGYLADKQVIDEAINLLSKWGLRSYIGSNALKQYGHFAGTDQERLSDLQAAMDNPEVKMIWALRGGYGSIRIVDQLDFTKIKRQPKLLVGFSDITILHQKLQQQGFESLHALMPVQLKNKISKDVIRQTKMALFDNHVAYRFKTNLFTSNFKQISGQVIGGNLANLYSLLGTNLDFDTHNKILFIEDVGEQLYQIDRMIIALKKAGKLKHLKALLVGQFTDIPDNNPAFGKSVEEIILEHTDSTIPVIFKAPIGHITDNYPLFLGKKLTISKQNDTIHLSQ